MLRNYVFPHPKTHKKAHLISWKAFLIYFLSFLSLQLLFISVRQVAPGVLGTTSTITSEQIISLTNMQREKFGQHTLVENKILDKAAEEKAQNMFSENYWAHISPSGKTPWTWMKKDGYDYLYAGENLARGYADSPAVVDAWMASKMGHRENILSSNYQEIGIAIEDGILNGEKTTLVVQMFGAPADGILAKHEVDNQALNTTTATNAVPQGVKSASTQTSGVSQLAKKSSFNPYLISKTFALVLFIIIGSIILIDVVVVYGIRKKKHNFALRHAPSFFVLLLILGAVFMLIPSSIL